MVRSLPTRIRPARSCSAPVACRDGRRERRRGHPGGPQHGAGRRARVTLPSWAARPAARRRQRGSRSSPCAARPPACRRVAGGLGGQLRAERCQRGVSRRRTAAPGRPRARCAGIRRAASWWPARGSARPAPRRSGPAPTRAKVSQRAALAGVAGAVSAISNAPNTRRRIVSASAMRLHAGRPAGELVVPEVGLLAPRRRRSGSRSRTRCASPSGRVASTRRAFGVDAGHLGHHAVDVRLLAGARRAAGRRSSPRTGCRSRTGTAAAGTGGAAPWSIRVTGTGARRSARAANRPAKPPPTITTRRRPSWSFIASLRRSVAAVSPPGRARCPGSGSSRSASFGPQLPLA